MEFDYFSAQDGAENDPKLLQDWPKTIPKPLIAHAEFWLQFWIVLGSILAPFWAPKSTPNRRQKSLKIKLRQHTSTIPPGKAPRPPQEAPRRP